jgi:hypothetical protein
MMNPTLICRLEKEVPEQILAVLCDLKPVRGR